MKLENIGFYSLYDKRAKNSSVVSDMKRCELVLTDRCNFSCPYCRGLREDCKGDMQYWRAETIIKMWASDNLESIRFSGGEPTLYHGLSSLIAYSQAKGIRNIAISTNGSKPITYYRCLINLGVNDFSISLDSCCSSGMKEMTGNKGDYDRIISNIQELSTLTYVTIGTVFTPENVNKAQEIIEFIHSLGVADIRIISSAQYNQVLKNLQGIDKEILNNHPILKYRITNFQKGRNVRGIKKDDFHRCPLVLDDMAIAGNWHFPCIIYMREQGNPIGEVNLYMREEREKWFYEHNTYEDKICRKNCLDVCIDYNNKWKEFQEKNDTTDKPNISG